jgi:hypothetical protein
MRDFSKVAPNVWHSRRFQGLASDDARLLYLYLLTSENQTSAGAYRLRNGTVCDDLQWELPRYELARTALVVADLIAFDNESKTVMVLRWFRHNPPMNPSHLKGIEREADKLDCEEIASRVMSDAQEAWQMTQQAKADRSGKVAPIGHGNIAALTQTKFMAGGRQ